MIIKNIRIEDNEATFVICKNQWVMIYYDEERHGWSINRQTIKSFWRTEEYKKVEGYREVAFITLEPLKEGEHGQQPSD